MYPPKAFLLRTLALVSLATSVEAAPLTIDSINHQRELRVSGTFEAGVLTLERGWTVTGPWWPAKNIFTLGPNALLSLPEPDFTAYYRVLAVDLDPFNGGFTNLIHSYSTLTTIAGSGLDRGNDVNNWKMQFEGASATQVELSRPHTAMADRASNVYIADKFSHSIVKVRPDGILVTVAGTHERGTGADGIATQSALNEPNGLWVQADGTVHIFDTGNSRIRRLDTNGLISTLFTITNGTFVGRGLYVSPDESLAYICEGSNVLKWTPEDGVEVLATGFVELGNLTLDHNGQLVVTDRRGHRVWRINEDGTRRNIAGNGSTFGGGDGEGAQETGLNEVRAVWFLPHGGYFLGTHRGSQIWYVDTLGVIHLFMNGLTSDTHAGDGTWFYAPNEFRVSEIRQITMDYEGNLLICENDYGYVRKVQFLRHVP